MPIYRIRKTTVEEFEVRAEDSRRALEMAHNDYSWDADEGTLKKVIIGLNYEQEQLRIDPLCEVNDGAACDRPGSVYHRKSKTWACKAHAKELDGIPVTPAPIPDSIAPAVPVAEEIPF